MTLVLAWILGLGAVALFFFIAAHLLLSLVLIIPTWRICQRAGFSGAVSLLLLVPLIGGFIVMSILAFSDWPAGEAQRQSASMKARL